MLMKLVDLTHTFGPGMPVYPGDAVPDFVQTSTIEKGGCNEYSVSGGMHVGTHVDAPLHMISGGSFISDIRPSQLIGRGRLIDARSTTKVTKNLVKASKVQTGDIVLVFTGWYKRFHESDYYQSFPDIDLTVAHQLADAGISMLGLDTPSPDRPPFLVHKFLLSNNILIIENLTNLEALVGAADFQIIALPPKIQCEAAPVRVIAVINN
jgi:kynurenine formamidase